MGGELLMNPICSNKTVRKLNLEKVYYFTRAAIDPEKVKVGRG